MNKMKLLAAAALAAAPLLSAQAQGLMSSERWFLQGAVAQHGTQTATAGLVWPWSWRTQLAGTEVTGYTEGYLSLWSARALGGGRQTLGQVGLVPVFRLRFGQGRSDWYAEGGIGVSFTTSVYHTPDKQFGSAGNFHDMLGVGMSFGADRSQDLALRIVHFSNAGIKKPNPGIEFLQLRYSRKF